MLGRRGSPFGLQLFSVAIVLVMFVYGFYLYKNVSSQLENVEKENDGLIVEKEDLSKDVQVLRESKSKLEEVLRDKEKSCSLNEERLGVDIKKIREDLSREKMSCDEKENSWNVEKGDFKLKIQELEESRADVQSKLERSESESKTLKEENFDLKKTKQESLNDIAKLKDEVANLERKNKEFVKYKELYEAQNPNLNVNKSEEKKEKEVEQDMQIAEPGKNKYYESHGTKKEVKKEDLDSQLNQSADKQVAAPSLEKKNHENIKNPAADLLKEEGSKKEIPEHQISKHGEFDVGGADQVERPGLKAEGMHVNKIEGVKDADDEGNNNFEDKQVEDKMQDAKREAVDDDEDMLEGGERGAQMADKADDVELKRQGHDGEP